MEKKLTDSRYFHLCEVWSQEMRRGYANFIMCLYIFTSTRLSTGLYRKNHVFCNLFYLFINKILPSIPIYMLPIVNHKVRKVLKTME